MGRFSFDPIFERITRYLIKRYLGDYIVDFCFEDISYSLSRGHCRIEKLQLNVQALNELSREYNLPFEFLHGYMENVVLLIPFCTILSESIVIEVQGLKLVVQPKERPQDVSMFDSMWGSMASSLQLAEECMKSNDNDCDNVSSRSEGLENIARKIETVLANMKVKFTDTSLKIEQVLPDKPTGISLEIKIANAEYFDEAGVSAPQQENEKSSHEPTAYSFKKIIFEGVSLFTSEFLHEERSFAPFQQGFASDAMETGIFVPGSPEMPPTHPSLPVRRPELSCNSDPVLISKLNGQQELRLKLKHNEAVIGPKVDVEFNFGAFNLFLTPQQVHLLFSLISGLMKPVDSNCDAAKKVQLSVGNKPMRPADYALVEQELLRQQGRCDVMTRSLKNQHGWSSHSLDESDDDFHLMTMENKIHHPYVPTSVSSQDDLLSSSMNSDTKSEASSYASSSRSRHRSSCVQAILTDPLSELTHFHGCFSSLLVIILHDDSVQETFGGDTRCDSESLKVQAETFFQDLLDLQLNGFNYKDFASAREPLSNLCQTNHLRLMASGIILDGKETSSSAERILKLNLSFNQFEVLECLFNSPTFANEAENAKYMKLMSFPLSDSSSDPAEACFKLKYSQVECTSQIQRSKPPPNKLDIQFGVMECDVDISLTDRIRTLLNYSNITDNANNKWDHWKESEMGIISSQTSSKTEVTISSANVTINLMFPIPDLRSVHDMERAPWWQQNIHKEVLILQFQEFSLKTTLDDDERLEKYEIMCQDVHGLFKIPNSEKPVSFLRISVDPDIDEVSRNNGFDWPRLEIRRLTKVVSLDLESGLEEMDEPYSCSLSYTLMRNMDLEPSPFCSTSIIHENKVDKEKSTNLSSDHDEIIKPAEKEAMQTFMEQIINKSKCVFEFTLPTVNIVLPDKEFFELLYNRLGSDLPLWSNTSLNSTSAFEGGGFKVHIPGLDTSYQKGPNDLYPIFRPFTNDSNSDSDEEETLYMSVHEYYQRQKHKHQKPNSANLTEFSVSFNITKGSLLVNSPLLDENNEVVPEKCGKLQLRVEDAVLFIATYYKGDPNESYICLLAEKSALYHDSIAQLDSNHPDVNGLTMNNDLKCIISASNPEMLLKSAVNLDNPNQEMLKFAVHIAKNPKQQIKTFKIAIEIADATLRHYVMPSPQMWINQLIEFLKVRDFPINGYIPPAVVTELHLNLSNCGIDYRPFKLAYRTAITVENFNMSCNVTAATPSFLFRIISEEMRLFISNNVEAKKVDLRQDYVCVFDSGLIDISIRTSVDDKGHPKLEMSISNNKVHIRTCADSFKALLELINYLGTNGDLEVNPTTQEENENERSNVSEKIIDPESENLDVLMAEAMKECCRVRNGDKKTPKPNSDFDYSNTDDEFCILEDDPGVGLIPRNGEPQIRILTDEPIRIIENHFSVPPGKSDVLKAPKHFPNPQFMLTLQEMSLVWHLYGGNDFKKKISPKKDGTDAKDSTPNRNKHIVTFSDQGNLDTTSVSFCKVTPMAKNLDSGVVQFSMEHVTINENQRNYCPESWLHKGGVGRNHDVLMELQMNKVQFQREIYPLDSEYSSRYILLVNDIEIRDRLAISQINKFLYHFTTKDLPRQSHANMIDIKAVYTRPDPKSSAEECSLRISCKPLRLNVDQDSLMFLVDFFQEVLGIPISDGSEGEGEILKENVPPSPNLLCNSNSSQNTSPDSETFYRYFSFAPDVLIRIDYHGKRVQMEQGALKGLLLGLGHLNASEIKLKRLCYRHGLLGHKKLISYALNEWQQDIFKNQLPSLLGGVGPMHSVVQLFQGVKDLFYLPVAQYRRDGQIVRGIQKGASSFSTSTIYATLDLTSRLFSALQGAAEIGFDMVSPGPRACSKFPGSQEQYRKSSQPADISEGVATAYNVVKEGLKDTARIMYRVAATEHEHKGVPGAVGGVLRQLPPAIIKPVILGSQGAAALLDGARHQLKPDAHQEDIHKWKTINN